MRINRNYKQLYFLNRKHGWLSRYGFAIAGWLGALVTTRSFVLANALYSEFIHDDYNTAIRKAVRYARYFSRYLYIFKDPFFDFTLAMDDAQRRALERFVKRNGKRVNKRLYLSDLLCIHAANIHSLLEQGNTADTEIQEFYKVADQLIGVADSSLSDDSKETDIRANELYFSEADAIAALQDIAALLPLQNWPWYVISGTFLGLHREGGFLPHDYDIDLGISAEDMNLEQLLETLRGGSRFSVKALDYYVEIRRTEGRQRCIEKWPAIVKIIHANGVRVDIFIHYTQDGCCWHGSILHRWDNAVFKLIQRELEGVTVNAPEDAELYLTENYGDWRTPIKSYDPMTGTPNLVAPPNFISLAHFILLYGYHSEHNLEKMQDVQNIMHRAGLFEIKDGKSELIRSI